MSEPISTPAAPPLWRVSSQSERTIIGPTGLAQSVIQVTFVLADGTGGSVNIPVDGYSVEAVRAAIADKAALLTSVASLTGS